VEVKVTGNKYFDEALLLSIAGINVGDEIVIPGGDNFSRAITKLWGQKLFQRCCCVYYKKLSGDNISLEIHVVERPRLSKFIFEGVGKSQSDDLKTKNRINCGKGNYRKYEAHRHRCH